MQIEAMKRTRASVADKPSVKRKSKIIYERQRTEIVSEVFNSGDDTILSAVVKADDLKQQLITDQLKKLSKVLCTNDQLLKTLFSTWHFTRCLHLAFHDLSPTL